jgi:hypothetical protein
MCKISVRNSFLFIQHQSVIKLRKILFLYDGWFSKFSVGKTNTHCHESIPRRFQLYYSSVSKIQESQFAHVRDCKAGYSISHTVDANLRHRYEPVNLTKHAFLWEQSPTACRAGRIQGGTIKSSLF